MNMLHCGHAGFAAMKSQARNIVFWPHIDSDIEQITKNCTECLQIIFQWEIFISK